MATTRLLSAMVATWNNVATAFTGLKLNVTDTASAAGSLLADLQVGGASKFSVNKTGEVISASDFWVRSNAANAGVYWGSSGDVFLTRDAANILALRNGTAAQAFNVYNTYADASNYERGYARWNAGVYEFGMEALGTGTPKHVRINRTSDANLYLGEWQVSTNDHLLANTDNLYDIGASGANRPRRGYFSGFVVTQSTTVAGLTAAATAGAGARSFVTDLNVTAVGNFGQPAVGGGANKGPVYSDGASWLIG